MASELKSGIPFAVQTDSGLHIAQGPPVFKDLEQFPPVKVKSCRLSIFSPNGLYFAYAFDESLKVLRTDTWKEVLCLDKVKVYSLVFSPKSNYLATWEPFEVNKEKPQGSPNLTTYDIKTGEIVKQFIHKLSTNWEPIWSEDEKLMSKLQGSDVVFFEDGNFQRIVARTKDFKVASYSLSSRGTYNVICHVPGNASQPSFGKLFKYPNLEATQSLANKTFMQCDNVEYYWSCKGEHCVLLISTELDKTGQSYYGKRSLHFMSVNGQSNLVPLSKEGAIHSVAWSPKSNEFCVVYGSMPAKVSIFNVKCDVVRELGVGPRNTIHYNPQGNILLLGGFGNLRGSVQLWDVEANKIIGNCDCSDTTLLEWCPDGVHFLTATTSPRLRIGNGYKIWHYTGALLHETDVTKLYNVSWKKFEKGVLPEPKISTEKVVGIASNKVQASATAYRPPSARNGPPVRFKLHDYDDPSKEAAPSKAALKMRKKREAKKARKEEEKERGDAGGAEVKSPASDLPKIELQLTGDVEKDKKIKKIEKKLNDIHKLKSDQKMGKTLLANQLTKINGEADLLKELKELQI